MDEVFVLPWNRLTFQFSDPPIVLLFCFQKGKPNPTSSEGSDRGQSEAVEPRPEDHERIKDVWSSDEPLRVDVSE